MKFKKVVLVKSMRLMENIYMGDSSKITDGWRKDIENYSIIEGGGIHLY